MLTSHDLGDIEELCERMVMIDKGRIVYDGALSDITTRFGWERSLHLTFSEPVPSAIAAAEGAVQDEGTTFAQLDETRLTIAFDSRRMTSGQLIRDLATALPVADIRLEEPTAESIIRKLYEGSLRFGDDDIGSADADLTAVGREAGS
jgi:ABC-2 type transport system ATP-binding protein